MKFLGLVFIWGFLDFLNIFKQFINKIYNEDLSKPA